MQRFINVSVYLICLSGYLDTLGDASRMATLSGKSWSSCSSSVFKELCGILDVLSFSSGVFVGNFSRFFFQYMLTYLLFLPNSYLAHA